MKRFIKNLIYKCIQSYFSFYRIQEKTVLFNAFGGKYTCNPKYISEKLHELHPEYKIIWVYQNSKNFPNYAELVKPNSFSFFKALYTSKVCVFNSGMIIPSKRKGQVYIDTWHGDRAFKNVSLSPIGERSAIAYKVIDYVLSGSDYADRIFREQLNFSGTILKFGTPRNDLFYTATEQDKVCIKESIGIHKFDKSILFAPTFRGINKGVEELNFSTLLDRLEKRDNCKWCCLIRQHYKVPISNKLSSDSRVINVSSYPDCQEILLISDLLISDYSSIVGDFVLKRKGAFLYLPDINEYSSTRGVNFDLFKSPFIIADTEDQLFDKIVDLTEDAGASNAMDILNFYGNVCESGSAAEQTIRFIEKL